MEQKEKRLESCVFCLAPKQNEVKLFCKHSFCYECIDVYCKKIRFNRRCPICRRNFWYYEKIFEDPMIVILDDDEISEEDDTDESDYSGQIID
ncbi:hypothetical protein KR222_006401 [Zaprionus bogoriensis]|nr:hypothetical protein KR222_006401 [Zaprionus bogoriensis]